MVTKRTGSASAKRDRGHRAVRGDKLAQLTGGHEARRAWREKGTESNISQLSVTTGLSRKAVTVKLRKAEDSLPHTELSAAAKTLT